MLTGLASADREDERAPPKVTAPTLSADASSEGLAPEIGAGEEIGEGLLGDALVPPNLDNCLVIQEGFFVIVVGDAVLASNATLLNVDTDIFDSPSYIVYISNCLIIIIISLLI